MHPKVNYVVTLWFGDRRSPGPHRDDSWAYFYQQMASLSTLKHDLSQITLVINIHHTTNITKIMDVISTKYHRLADITKVFVRPNIGISYGAFSAVFEYFRESFDYYIFIEDDYIFTEDNFDSTLVSWALQLDNCGVVCGYVSDNGRGVLHPAISNGIYPTAALSKVYKHDGRLPHYADDTDNNGYAHHEVHGQLGMGHAFNRNGLQQYDWLRWRCTAYFHGNSIGIMGSTLTPIFCAPVQALLGPTQYVFTILGEYNHATNRIDLLGPFQL